MYAKFLPVWLRILVVLALLLSLPILLVAILQPHNVCGNGPITKWELKPTVVQATYVVLTVQNTKGVLPDVIRSSYMTDKGIFVGGLTGGLFFVTPTTIETCQLNGQKVEGTVNSIQYDKKTGMVRAVTDGHGTYHIGNSQWRNYTTEDGMTDDRQYAITTDAQGNIYVSTWEGISIYYPETDEWSRSDLFADLHISSHTHVTFFGDSEIWVGTINKGVARKTAEGWQYYNFASTPQLGSNNARTIVQAPDGKIWVGSDPGLAIFDPQTGQWENAALGPKPETYGVMAIQFDDKGQAWVTGPVGTDVIRSSGGSDAFWLDGLTLALGQKGWAFGENTVIIGGKHGLYIGDMASEGK